MYKYGLLLSIPLLFACVDKLRVSDRPCPCAKGWRCCANADLCVPTDGVCPGESGCEDACESADLTRCTAGGVEICELKGSGCLDWSAPTACADNEYCSDGQCRCYDQCALGSATCVPGPASQACETKSNGCLGWSDEVACSPGWTCRGGRCVNNCIDHCDLGQRWCDGTNGVQVCELKPSSCYDWSATIPCAGDLVCRLGECLSQDCVDGTVTPGPEICDGDDNDCDGQTDELEVDLVSRSAFGIPFDIAVEGRHAFLADRYGLAVFDIENPTSPVQLAAFPTPEFAGEVDVHGTIAALGDSSDLRILDVSDPAAPVEISSVPLADTVESVHVSASTILVSTRDKKVYFVDITVPQSPNNLGVISPSHAEGLYLRGEVAWIMRSMDASQLLAVDVANPQAPQVLGSVDLVCGPYAGGLFDLGISDQRAITAGPEGVCLVDISDPAAPKQLSSFQIDAMGPITVAIEGDRALIGGWSSLMVLDISDPKNPTLAGELELPTTVSGRTTNSVTAAALDQDIALVTTWDGLLTVDLATPSTPQALALSGPTILMGEIAYDNGRLAALDTDQTLRIYALGASDALVETGTLDFTPDRPFHLAMVGESVVVSFGASAHNLRLVDISAPQPMVSSPLVFSHTPADFAATGSTVVVASGASLWTLDVSDPTQPDHLGELTLGKPTAVELDATATHAYVVVESGPLDDQLVVVSLSDPADPRVLGDVGFYGGPYSVIFGNLAVDGSLVYFVNTNLGLLIFDVSIPTQPELVGEWQGALQARDVTGRFPYAFVAAEVGIHIVDVSDASDPVAVDVLDTPGLPRTIGLSESSLYLNDDIDLAVYDLGGCLD